MKEVQMFQTIINMEEGRIYYYCQVKENDNYIRKDTFSVSMEKINKIAEANKDYEDADIDAAIVKEVYSKIYNEYFRVKINGVDKSDEYPTEDVLIRRELEAKNLPLQDLFELLDQEENNFKSLTGILRLTAKFKMIVINELITKEFNELEAEYEKYERGLI